MTDQSGQKKYSRAIQLHNQDNNNFSLLNIINPFTNTIDFDIAVPNDTKINAELLDISGKVIQTKSYIAHSGINSLSLSNTRYLPSGIYIFRIKNNEQVINRKVLKKNYGKSNIPNLILNNGTLKRMGENIKAVKN